MATADIISSMKTNISNAYAKISAQGGTVPTNKNLANLTTAIGSIKVDLADPNPTLDKLKATLNSAASAADVLKKFPYGTEFPDTYDGASNPLILVDVANYNIYTSSTATASKLSAVLQRKFVNHVGQVWDTTNDNQNYTTSTVNTFLQGTYLTKCSTTLKNLLAEVKVPVVIASGETPVKQKFFLPSAEEVYGDPTGSWLPGNGKEGHYWPYWKERSGHATPYNGSANRSVYKGNAFSDSVGWWLRSRNNTTTASAVVVNYFGSISNSNANTSGYGVLPACIISKS